MRILFVLEHYIPHVGGVEILFQNLISGLLEKGHEVTVLTTKFRKNLAGIEKASSKLTIVRVGSNRYNFMRYALRKGFSLAKKADLIHTTTYNAAVPAWILGKLTGRKVVITVHEIFAGLRYTFYGLKGFFFKLYERLIFCFPFDRYICVSNYTKNSLRLCMRVPDHKLITVYNGIDYSVWDRTLVDSQEVQNLRTSLGFSENYVGLFFGRPGISKGLEYFLKAIPRILEKIPHFKALLIVARDDAYRFRTIFDLVKKLGISDSVLFHDSVRYTDLKTYILASDVTVVPSLVEGFGFAAAEVSALGAPLVVTNIGSLPEVVSGRVNFVEPSNSDDIADKVIDFFNNAYDLIDNKEFLWKESISSYEKVYYTSHKSKK